MDGLDYVADWIGDHDIYSMLLDAAVQARNREALENFIALAEKSAASYGHKFYLAVVARAKGVRSTILGEYSQANAHLERALETFTAMQTHWQTGRTYAELGEVAVQQGKKEEARRYFEQAIQEYSLLGAQPDIAKAQEKLQLLQ